MPGFTLTEKQYADLKHILMCDNSDIADHPEFIEDPTSGVDAGFDAKKYIDERVELCKALGIDFWESAAGFSRPFNIRRLKAIHAGQSINEYEEKHERPTGIENIKDLINTYEEQKGLPITAFDIFSDSELPLLAVKCTAENVEFQRLLQTLSEDEKESFLSKYQLLFILRHGKEKEEELIDQFVIEYRNKGFGICNN